MAAHTLFQERFEVGYEYKLEDSIFHLGKLLVGVRNTDEGGLLQLGCLLLFWLGWRGCGTPSETPKGLKRAVEVLGIEVVVIEAKVTTESHEAY